MQSVQSGRKVDREPQEFFDSHRLRKMPVEELAAGIFENEHRPPGFATELDGPYSPCAIQLVPQLVFMRETIENCACRVLDRGHRDQNCGLIRAASPRPPVQDAIGALRQKLETTKPIGPEDIKRQAAYRRSNGRRHPGAPSGARPILFPLPVVRISATNTLALGRVAQ
jgi:hypothetical protein